MSDAAVNYQALEVERANELQNDLEVKLKEASRKASSGDFKGQILGYVAAGNYDLAVQELEEFMDFRRDFPNLKPRIQRYLDHGEDLVRAIEGKRNFPGLGSLSLAKQQDIYESVLGHFEELKSILTQIEKVERELKLDDVRSTVWFVSVTMNCAFFIVSLGFFIEVLDGLGHSFNVVFTQMVSDLVDKIL